MTEVYTNVAVPDLYEQPAGLFDAVSWLTPADTAHWQGGIQYDVDCPAVALTINPCFPGVVTGGVNAKTTSWDRDTRGARAFTVYDEFDCSPAGQGLTEADLEEGITAALKALSWSAPLKAEYAFWTGDVSNTPTVLYPHLNHSGAAVRDTAAGAILLQPSSNLITGTLDVVEGLGRLEEAAAACYPGKMWIHAPVVLGPALARNGLVTLVNGRLQTMAGNRVILGRGYPATVGPGGVTNAVGTTQMYATSPVFGLKAPPRSFTPRESFNRSVNTVKYIAEQTYLLSWKCCLLGVTVSVGGEITGTFAAAT